MDYRYTVPREGGLLVGGVRNFDPETIFESGQCFRWNRAGPHTYEGIAHARRLRITWDGDRLFLEGADAQDFEEVWQSYFDLERDYGALKGLFCSDDAMMRAVRFAPGMRVLRQDPWEALCSFILSQNNNIPRIKGIVERLCAHLGDPIPGGGHAFPRPEQLAPLAVEDLAPIRAGFRAKYILDAARRVASGQVALSALADMPVERAKAQLTTIYGVGDKVSDCALLYGCGHVSCMPKDVWIGRVLAQLYPDGFPERFGPVAGIAQQYLFHYARLCEGALEKNAAV